MAGGAAVLGVFLHGVGAPPVRAGSLVRDGQGAVAFTVRKRA